MDEMDLVRQALDVTPWRPEAYEQARVVLRGAMAEAGPPQAAPAPRPAPVRGRGIPRAGNRRRAIAGARGKIGLGAAIAAVAAAAAVVLATTSTPAPQPAAATSPASPAPAATSKLVTLAALIKASDAPQPGNASLVIDKQVNGGKLMQVVYALDTDSGRLYTGDDKKTLMAAVAGHANQADGTNASELVAAQYAATGDLATARVRMVNALPNCFGLGLSPANQKKIWAKCVAASAAIRREKGIKTTPKQPTGQALQDQVSNSLWTAATIALSWGAGDPQIRAGVLRLLSTIPQVTVANSTTAGQATLTVTAGPALFGDGSKQVLTINAKTGIPVSSVESGGGLPTAVETSQVSRVTLADIQAGKF